MIGLPRRLAQRPCIFRHLRPGASPAKRVRPSGANRKLLPRSPPANDEISRFDQPANHWDPTAVRQRARARII